MMASDDVAMMYGERLPVRSEAKAMMTVKQVARTYGGMVRSCADAAVKPRALMMLGWRMKFVSGASPHGGNGGRWTTYKKEGERIQWERHGMIGKRVEVALRVLERKRDVVPSKTFVVGSIAVGFQTVEYKALLRRRQPSSGGGIISDEEIRAASENDGQKSFLRGSQNGMLRTGRYRSDLLQ